MHQQTELDYLIKLIELDNESKNIIYEESSSIIDELFSQEEINNIKKRIFQILNLK